MVIFQLRKSNLLYMHQIGIIKTAAATISISVLYILYIFFYLHYSRFIKLFLFLLNHLKMLQCLHNCFFLFFRTLWLFTIICFWHIIILSNLNSAFFFTCEIYRLETFIPSLCSATYFFISS